MIETTGKISIEIEVVKHRQSQVNPETGEHGEYEVVMVEVKQGGIWQVENKNLCDVTVPLHELSEALENFELRDTLKVHLASMLDALDQDHAIDSKVWKLLTGAPSSKNRLMHQLNKLGLVVAKDEKGQLIAK